MGRYQKSLLWAFNQFINHTSQNIAYKFDSGYCKPTRIIFCLTLRCNIKCKQCGIWKSPKKPELSTEEWKKVMIGLKDWLGPYRVQIAGGEIFIRNDVVDLVKFASDNNILMGIVSNGTMLNEKIANNLIDSGLSYFDISIDGILPETHDYIRGVKGVYEKATASIQYLKKHRERTKSDLSITIATVIMGPNMGELVDIVKWVQEEGLNGIMFNPLGPACDSSGRHWYEKSELWPREQDMNKLNDSLDQLIEMKKNGAPILNSADQFVHMKTYFRNPAVAQGHNCMVGMTNFLMSCDGDVHLCFRMPSIGNFKNLPSQIWRSDNAKKVRKKIRQCSYECSPGNFIYRRSLIKEIQRYLQYR
jgi:MoaA/NifB/PqqE/SkfB family radical SAM enzyme